MNGPFDKGIDAQTLAILLAISEEMAEEAEVDKDLIIEDREELPDELEDEE